MQPCMATGYRRHPMTEPVRFEKAAPGVFWIRNREDAKRVLADPGLDHWVARDRPGRPLEQAIARWLDAMDPAMEHPARRTLKTALSQRIFSRLIPDLTQVARSLIAHFSNGGAIDIFEAYARPLTSAMVGRMLGIDPASAHSFAAGIERLESEIAGALFPSGHARDQDSGFFADWAAMLRAARLPGGLVEALEADLVVTGQEELLGMFLAMFAFAATGNISRFIAQSAIGLARQPGLYATLRRDPAAIGPALDEWLRIEPPLNFIHLVARNATADGLVPAGASILVALADANRCAATFSEPEQFCPQRREPHLSFGHGRLACIGANSARGLAALALGELVAQFDPAETGNMVFPMLALNPVQDD